MRKVDAIALIRKQPSDEILSRRGKISDKKLKFLELATDDGSAVYEALGFDTQTLQDTGLCNERCVRGHAESGGGFFG